MSRILSDVKFSLIAYFRNKGALFWTLVFPIILFLLMGYLFGGQSGPVTLYYQDDDNSAMSMNFTQSLINGTASTVVEMKNGAGMDLAKNLTDGKISAYIVIPKGFEKNALAASSTGRVSDTGIEVYYDKSKSSSGIVISVIEQAVNGLNLGLAHAQSVVPVKTQDVATASMTFIDFLLPGIIGMSIMSSAVNGTVSTTARNRATGVFRKLATTPISRIEWNAARIITQTIILMLSISISLLVAWLMFHVQPSINVVSVLMIIFGAAVFSGLGMIITTFVKDVDSAENAASAITFPLMFVSGSFISVDSMPWFLQYLADVSPLTYLNNGLRSSMITGNYGDAVMNLAIVGVLGIVLFVVGVALLKWKED